MRFFITKKVLVGVIIALCGIIYLLCFSGCSAGLRPPDKGTPGLHGGPADALARLAVWATWAAGIGLLLCGLAAIFRPSFEIAKVALGCFAGLLIAGILHWISAHWAILVGLCAAVVVLYAVGWVWLHRTAVKKKTGIDLNWLCRVKAKP